MAENASGRAAAELGEAIQQAGIDQELALMIVLKVINLLDTMYAERMDAMFRRVS